jgi:hypothetical protein
MKKISKQRMAAVEGGVRCIYHSITVIPSIFGILINPLGGFFHGQNLIAFNQCMGNNHNE